MRLSKIGKVALLYWEDIPNYSANTGLDAFVMMPNHLHGIVRINRQVTNDPCRDVACNVSTTATTADVGACDAGDSRTTGGSGTSTVLPERGSLGDIVRSYKSAVTRWCRMHGYTSFAWQPRFYDHVIRDRAALHKVRRYILDNPAKWELDKNNLERRAYGMPG
jgi:REP element-mobilizing transposase RayT